MKHIQIFFILFFIGLINTSCFLKSVHPLVSDEEAILVEGLEVFGSQKIIDGRLSMILKNFHI